MTTTMPQSLDSCFVLDEAAVRSIAALFAEAEERIIGTLRQNWATLEEEQRAFYRQAIKDDGSRYSDAEVEERVARDRAKRQAYDTERFLGVSVAVSCSDNSSKAFETVDEFLKFPNSAKREIRSLRFRSKGYSAKPKISVEFNSQAVSRKTISYAVEGDDDEAFYFSRKIDEIIDGIRPWYDKYWIEPISVFTKVGVVGSVIVLVVSFFGEDISPKLSVAGWSKAAFFSAIVVSIGAPWVASWIWSRVLRLFPKAVFALNDGKRRYETLEKRRGIIGTVVVLGFIVSVVAGLATNWIGQNVGG